MAGAPEPPVLYSRATENSREFSHAYVALHDALLRDVADMRRQVLVWQRWFRYAAVLALAALAVAFGTRSNAGVWLPAVVAIASYVVFNMLLGWRLERGGVREVGSAIPALVLTADVTIATILVYVSSTPAQCYRVLLLGFLVLQLTVFYFGWALGLWVSALTIVAYVVTSFVLPPFVPGPRPLWDVVGFNAAIFVFATAMLTYIFGSFRTRMNRLRLLHKRVEMQDFTGTLGPGWDQLPDDLTLLGKGFIEMRGRLIELIGTDPLTNCLNRRALEQRLGREWRQARRRNATIALCSIDIDHFKQINDTHGHPVGDVVLHELAELMRATARETDAVARIGGDEFVVLLPDTGWDGATAFAERLRRNVEEHIFGGDLTGLRITISVGIALARGTDPISPEQLLEESDRSLYRAKSGGRNRIFA